VELYETVPMQVLSDEREIMKGEEVGIGERKDS
jgi:hypothetical protein